MLPVSRCFPLILFLLKSNIIDQVVVSFSGEKWPASPIPRTETLPLGRMVTQVIEACFKLNLNQASGGNCKARQIK